jgi:methyl-accepting chemotaxis protein
MSEDKMQMPQRAEKAFEWNLNTILAAVTLATILIGGVGVWNDTRRDIQAIEEWKVEHETEGKDRRATNEANAARLGGLYQGLDDRIDTIEGTIPRISDRQAATERSYSELATTMREVQQSLNKQDSRLEVIIAWIDEQRKRERP